MIDGQEFNPHDMFDGSFIPEWLSRSPKVSPGAKLIYGRLKRYKGRAGDAYPAVHTLAAEVGLSERQTQRYLSELEEIGLMKRIVRAVGGKQTSNEYRFIWKAAIIEVGVTEVGVTDMTPLGVTDVSPKESHTEESHLNTIHQNGKTAPFVILNPTKATLMGWFDGFWSAYPRKIGKAAALKAWVRLVKDEDVYRAIMSGVALQASGMAAKEKQFIPHPATWLNGRRWEDDVELPTISARAIPIAEVLREIQSCGKCENGWIVASLEKSGWCDCPLGEQAKTRAASGQIRFGNSGSCDFI